LLIVIEAESLHISTSGLVET